MPRVVVLYGETGRGKTYRVQQFYDLLAALRPGYFMPGLTPSWPPVKVKQVLNERKRIQPNSSHIADAEKMTFRWIGVGASPEEGAAQVDMAAVFAEQMRDQMHKSVRIQEHDQEVKREIYGLAMDAIGAMGPLFNLPATIGNIRAHTVKISQLHNIEELDRVVHKRLVLHRAFASASKFERGKIPTIVALDDAQSAGYETLSLLSGLIAEGPGKDGQDDERGRVYMPEALDASMPSPLLIVCTIWEHRMNFQDAFQMWLQELVDVGVHVTRIECEPMDLDTVHRLLNSWDEKGSRAIGNEVIDHIAFDANGLRVVNPLVLAQCVGLMEQSRDDFTNELTVDDQMIERFPVSPDQHLRDRLERLRENQDGGRPAVGLLELAVAFGPEVPHQVFSEFETLNPGHQDTLREALSLLEHDGLLSPTGSVVEKEGQFALLHSHRVDSDMQMYMSRLDLSTARRKNIGLVARALMHWCVNELLPNELARLPVVSMRDLVSAMASAANIVLSETPDSLAGDSDAIPIALCLLPIQYGSLPATEDWPISALGLGYAYAPALGIRLDDAQILSACSHYGYSRVTARILKRRLLETTEPMNVEMFETLVSLLKSYATSPSFARILSAVHAKNGQVDAAIEVLHPFSGDPSMAMNLASLLAGRGWVEKAIDVLEPLAALSQNVATELSRLLVRRGRVDDAIFMLEPLAALSSSASTELSRLLVRRGRVDDAILVLEPLADRSDNVAIDLSRLLVRQGRVDDAILVLEPLADRSDNVATELAGLLVRRGRVDDAILVLEPLADRFGNVAIDLSRLLVRRGRVDDAILVLEPLADRFDHAAIDLSRLLVRQGRVDDAILVLEPLAALSDNVAIDLSRLLVRQGRVDDAILVLEPLAALSENVATELSRLLERQGRVDDAIFMLQPLAPLSSNVSTELAGLLERRGRVDDAILVLEPLAARFHNVATELASLLERQGRVDDAILMLEPLADRFEGAALRLASLLVAQGRVDDAILVLEPLADRFQGAAQRLASLLVAQGRVDDAILMLEPLAERWPIMATRLGGLLVRQRRFEESIAVLRATPESARRIRHRGTLAAALLLANETAAGLEELHSIKKSTWQEYYALSSLVGRSARPDLLALLVETEMALPIMHRVVADQIIRVAQELAQRGENASPRDVAMTVWRTPRTRQEGARKIRSALMGWVKDTDSPRPPMSPFQALSCLEVVLAIGQNTDRVFDICKPPFVELLKESRDSMKRFVEISATSAVARRLINAATNRERRSGNTRGRSKRASIRPRE